MPFYKMVKTSTKISEVYVEAESKIDAQAKLSEGESCLELRELSATTTATEVTKEEYNQEACEETEAVSDTSDW